MTSETEGVLERTDSGRWSIHRPGLLPLEITSGDLFRVEVNGRLKPTRMEYRHGDVPGYYSIDGFELHNGMRAAIADSG